MNSFHLLIGSALFSLLFVGCETAGTTGGSGGGNTRVVMYPTVDQMANLEKSWGLEPRQVRPKGGNNLPEIDYAPSDAGPSNTAPPPQPNMIPPAPEPVLDPPQPTVDPSTIQKLR